ncbi:MAG: asparagine synthase (glutamine-hydrolyzing) [Planctomycetes bacterium]|nr:asparagine synthase (glutamine-hydrolyzing) [Planctomycetota bacterium]
MCGLCGYALAEGTSWAGTETLSAMTSRLVHRGPDDGDVRVFQRGEGLTAGRIAVAGLGHRRLSILDLSPAGRQPMGDEAGSAWLCLNGEIYNHAELRAGLELSGVRFRSGADTEALLHLLRERGAAALASLRGMFAFAFLDVRKGELLLARDRLGKKPLFWAEVPGGLVFASEPKALLACPAVDRAVDPDGIDALLTYGYVPAPGTLFRGIRALEPGTLLTWSGGAVDSRRYWEPRPAPGVAPRTVAEAEEGLLARLEEAVRVRLGSDVPLGAFLSGGIDSSLLVAALRRHVTRPRTFTVGFEDRAYDERPHALRVARALETEHEEFVVRPEGLEELFPRLVDMGEQGMADSSTLPTYYLSRLARSRVTVALSGDGGDELFAGYSHYQGEQFARGYGMLPYVVGEHLANSTNGLHLATRLFWPRAARMFARVNRVLKDSTLAMDHRWRRKRSLIRGDLRRTLYQPAFAGALDGRAHRAMQACFDEGRSEDFVRTLGWMDLRFYLPNDMLMKVDGASMAVALEVRTPFLDHALVEYALALPSHLKLRRFTTKYLLRRLADRLLPPGIAWRRKQGFGVPLSAWFQGSLVELAKRRLLSAHSRSRAYLREESVRQMLDEERQGVRDHAQGLWVLLWLETWLAKYAA